MPWLLHSSGTAPVSSKSESYDWLIWEGVKRFFYKWIASSIFPASVGSSGDFIDP